MPSLRTAMDVVRLAAHLGLSALAGPGRRRPTTLEERLAAFPTKGLPLRDGVRVHWNEHQVPFIKARSDTDLAVTLGVVHAHLRLAQMEILRRVSQGRVAEMVGPVAFELDVVLRTIGLGRAVPEMTRRLPDETRAWLEAFAAGINRFVERMPARPRDLAVLGIEPEPWTVADLLTIGRLAAADFTWHVWFRLLRLRGRPDWAELWERLMGGGAAPVPSFAGSGAADPEMLDRVLRGCRWPGSNSFAVGGARSATGSALLASDPHLAILLPNLWLMAGYKSPSYHAVGLMIPGVPVVALGRNPWIAWGGTNLHAASSELFDVTDLPGGEIRHRRERVRVRWRRDREITVRETPFGPIISDAPLLRAPPARDLALHWIGHTPTDEVTALLRLNRARNWAEFRAALDEFAIPAQNMIYADAQGHVGQAMAAKLPRRPIAPPTDLFAAPETRHRTRRHWEAFVTSRDLPALFRPARGFVASANNRPAQPPPVPVGFFFSPDDRIRRLTARLSETAPLRVDDVATLQRDVLVPSAPELRDALLDLLRSAGAGGRDESGRRAVMAALESWNGAYEADSAGALAFELLVYHFIEQLHGREHLPLYSATWDPWALLRDDLTRKDRPILAAALDRAVGRAGAGLRRFRVWGAFHRLRLSHLLGAVPGAGRAFRFADLPAAGANETVMKAAHGLTGRRHSVRFGSNARHVSDLSDPDANFFVLLGGQDGWLGSTTFLDQLPLWRRGAYIQLPLRPETVRARFPHKMDLAPQEPSR